MNQRIKKWEEVAIRKQCSVNDQQKRVKYKLLLMWLRSLLPISIVKREISRNSLAVQWLGLGDFTRVAAAASARRTWQLPPA